MPWRKRLRLAIQARSSPDEAAGAGITPNQRSRWMPRPSRALRWVAIMALLVLTLRAAQQIDFSKVARALGSASISELIAAAGANVLALAMQSGRWLAVVHPVEPRAKPSVAFFALVAGYAIGLVIPARASDLARAHLMSRRSGGSTATLTTTTVVDHLLGSIALLAAIGAAAAVWPLPAWIRGAGHFAAAVALTLLVALWLVRPRRTIHDGAVVPGRSSGTLLMRLRTGLTAVGRPRAIAMALVFAVAGWCAEGVIAHLALRAFGLPSGVGPSMMAVVATTLSAALSVSPGNAGAFEIACVVALAGFGVPREAALAFAIGYHCVHLIPTAVIGGGWLIGTGFRPAMLRSVT